MKQTTPQFRIFYSWQSDYEKSKNIIDDTLRNVVRCMKVKNISINIEQGGGGTGFVNIEDAVRQKIRMCDIFVGDITPVTSYQSGKNEKKVPNSNVMYELGIATESMGAENIIVVAINNGDWKFETLPFDVNHSSFVKINDNKDDAIKLLSNQLLNVIKSVIQKARKSNDGYFAPWTLQKNINSGKFLPDTYLEDIDILEKVRCFVEPIKYYDKVVEYLERCDFTLFNMGKIVREPKTPFRLSLKPYDLRSQIKDVYSIESISQQLLQYLNGRINTLHKQGNGGWSISHKLHFAEEVLPFFKAKYLLILSDAGVGKTNFICNLVQNLFLGDGIPYLYVNAYELSATYVEQSLAYEHNYIGNGSLEEVFFRITKYCEQSRQYIFLIIDGLNEHPDYKLFVHNLVKVFKALSNYPYVKVIFSCRNDFYNNHMDAISETLGDDLLTIQLNSPNTANGIRDYSFSRLVERYMKYFEIKGNLNKNVRKQLKTNMLLFRLFFEAYKGKNISSEQYVKYDDVFERYYCLQCKEINKLVKSIATADVCDNLADKFFNLIISWMISKQCFSNISYNSILDQVADNEKKFFPFFINSNLLIKKDIIDANDDSEELLNFTFEDIRDFLIARYLIKSFKDINISQTIEVLTNPDNNCAEGVEKFLFLLGHNLSNHQILDLICLKDWYLSVLESYIWYIKDENIKEEDYNSIFINSDTKQQWQFLIRIINTRWNMSLYKNFNILIALDRIESLDIEGKNKFIQFFWPSLKSPITYQRDNDNRRLNQYLSDLGNLIARQQKEGNAENVKALLRWLTVFSDVERVNKERGRAQQIQLAYENNKIDKYLAEEPMFNPKQCHLFSYDVYKYLLLCNQDLSLDKFLIGVGVKDGFAKEMFTQIYNAIFVESDNIQDLFDKYYQNEYKSMDNFLQKYFSLSVILHNFLLLH